jgi:hypothetical protein
MKKILFSCFFFLITVSLFISCERDDICAEATVTTPKLVIDFFFDDNTQGVRNVVDLEVREVNKDTSDVFGVFNASSIAIPLKTDAIETSYVFNLNSQDESGGLTDTLIFSYATERIYVNRACGFKVNFIDFSARLVNPSDNPEGWVQNIRIDESIIENESETHLSIFY